MGNSQSQEAEAAAPSQVDPEEAEFDLSKIPDDRETATQVADIEAQTPSSTSNSQNEDSDAVQAMTKLTKPFELAEAAQVKKRSKKKKKSTARKSELSHIKSPDITSNGVESDELSRRSPPATRSPDSAGSDRPLEETEPETYHIYATSDQSEVEDEVDDKQPEDHPSSGFVAVNGSSQKSTTARVKAKSDDADNEEGLAPTSAQAQRVQSHVDGLNLLASAAATQPALSITPSQADPEIPPAKVNSEGRFLCPFADAYGCTITLVDRKGARRHAKTHLKDGQGVAQPVSGSKAEPVAQGAVSHPTTTIPAPTINSEGQFPCPLAGSTGCNKTFAHSKGARRHAQLHLRDSDRLSPLEIATQAVTIEIPPPPINGQKQTNANEKAAASHLQSHFTNLTCLVCKKQLSRKDKLKNHIKLHSAEEIAAAENNATVDSEEEASEASDEFDAVVDEQEVEEDAESVEQQNVDDGSEPDVKQDVVDDDQPLEEQDVEDNTESSEEQEQEEENEDDSDVERLEVNDPQQELENLEEQVEVADEQGLNDDTTEFTTPQETSQLEAVVVEEPINGRDSELDLETIGTEPLQDGPEDVSGRVSTTPPSVFDAEDVIVKETPMLQGKSKRKRTHGTNSQVDGSSLERPTKRRLSSPSSPPTSLTPNDFHKLATPKSSSVTSAIRRRQDTDKIVPRLQPRQGSMDGWAQKFTKDSGLKHPTLNPTPPRPNAQRIEVLVPQTSKSGPSSKKPKTTMNARPSRASDADEGRIEADSSAGLKRKHTLKTSYSTPKGKKRAEPDVEYSTPAKEPTMDEDDADESDQALVTNLATSVAKRTFPGRGGGQVDDRDDHHGPEDDIYRAPESDSEAQPPAKRPKTTKKTATPRSSKKPKATSSTEGADCPRCHRQFTSEEQLRQHQKKPSAHVGLLKCFDCSEEFWAITALARHEKDTGHGKGNGLQGRTGAFSQVEVTRLNKWRGQFCEYHNISTMEFNEMMSATLDRTKSARWDYSFVKKAEFLKEYVGVLPNRNKRSMLRYRERNFQNLEGMRNWTAEDDQDLIRLQKELGSKWAEIGRQLGRTVDAVSQRWRHKLQYGGVETGEFSRAERKKFNDALDELRHDDAGNELKEFQIPWSKVAQRLGNRSAQQCSNHYRALQRGKKGGKLVKRSEDFIREDDDGNDEADAEEEDNEEPEEEDEADDGEQSASEAEPVNGAEPEVDSEEDEAEDKSEKGDSRSPSDNEDDSLPQARSNPLLTKTPGKTLHSSQLFEQTQANTSALKPLQGTAKTTRKQASQDRPSPNIPIELRRQESRSPLKELDISETGELDREHEEDDEDRSIEHLGSQELGTVDHDPEDEEKQSDDAESDEQTSQSADEASEAYEDLVDEEVDEAEGENEGPDSIDEVASDAAEED